MAGLGVADRAAAEELFTACYPRLAGWVRRLVDDDDTAHEIASEAFTRLLARWHKPDNPQSYLYMIAANLARDHWRKAGRERRAISAMAAARPDRGYRPVQDVDVRALILALPASMRSAFLLHYYAGFALRPAQHGGVPPRGVLGTRPGLRKGGEVAGNLSARCGPLSGDD